MVQAVHSTLVAGKYQLLEEIGRGGMGAVWRAHSVALGLDCALKMVLPQAAIDPREQLRLFREARIVAKLHSPYVVTVYDVGEWEGGAYLAMELLEGQSLGHLLAVRRVLSIADTVELVRQVALGLDKAHAAGLVHRDLKPDNIFIVEQAPLQAKILDFGIAKQLDFVGSSELLTVSGSITGTPQYMSPEQANASKHVDFRADLWSLAVICFECLTGQPPFTGEGLPHLLMNIVLGPIPVPSSIRPSLPPAFDAWWAGAASREPERRPQSALALAESLRDVFAENAGTPDSLGGSAALPLAAASTAARTRWLGRAALAAGIAAGAGVAAYYYSNASSMGPGSVASESLVPRPATSEPPLLPALAPASPKLEAAAVTTQLAPPEEEAEGVRSVLPQTLPASKQVRAETKTGNAPAAARRRMQKPPPPLSAASSGPAIEDDDPLGF